MARFLYDEKVDEACPGLRVGRAARPDSMPAEIYYHKDDNDNLRTVVATIKKVNIQGGSEVTDEMRAKLREILAAYGIDEMDYDKYQAGHVLGFFFGGSGELQDNQNNNIVPQVRQLNQGPYNRAGGILRNFVRQMPDGMEVHLNIIVNESIPADNANSSIPANFRIVWCSSDRTTFYRSPLFENNTEHTNQLREISSAQQDEFLHGEYFETRRNDQLQSRNHPEPYNNPIIVVTRQEQQPEEILVEAGIEVIPRPPQPIYNIESINFPGIEGEPNEFRGRIEQ
jgi:hypothetical protein